MSDRVLAGFASNHASCPAWFDAGALDSVRGQRLEVLGTPISYRVYPGAEGAGTPLIFVHGGNANARWWDATIAALGPDRAPAVALDLSGHGDSGRRHGYSIETWMAEIIAVMERVAPEGCIVVGHSLGGELALGLARSGHPLVDEVVSIDAAPGGPRKRRRTVDKAGSTPKNWDVAMSKFMKRKHTWPFWLADYVAARSLEQVGYMWEWKHDPSVADIVPDALFPDLEWTCPVKVVLGALSSLSPSREELLQWSTVNSGNQIQVFEVPDAGHDIMMENPMEFSELLRNTAGHWLPPADAQRMGNP